MANEEKKVVEETKVESEEKKSEETKSEEPKKKEFILIRAAKATGRGIKKAGECVLDATRKHPGAAISIATTLGYVIRMGVEYVIPLLSGNSEEASTESSLPELPEGTDNYVDLEDEPIEIEIPEETTEE